MPFVNGVLAVARGWCSTAFHATSHAGCWRWRGRHSGCFHSTVSARRAEDWKCSTGLYYVANIVNHSHCLVNEKHTHTNMHIMHLHTCMCVSACVCVRAHTHTHTHTHTINWSHLYKKLLLVGFYFVRFLPWIKLCTLFNMVLVFKQLKDHFNRCVSVFLLVFTAGRFHRAWGRGAIQVRHIVYCVGVCHMEFCIGYSCKIP